MERKNVVLVDIFNNPIGEAEKYTAHKTPQLHRAFSVFLVNNSGEILIQKRALDKYHSGGKWANACCSHPENKDEGTIVSASKRVKEELGIDEEIHLKELFSFIYFAKFADDLYEYEHDTVFVGFYDGEIVLDETEASEYEWVSKQELAKRLTQNPEDFSVWFLSCAPRVLEII